MLSDAIAEYRAAAILGEDPDIEEPLGEGYESDEVPDGFADRHQAAIWREVLEVLRSDDRGNDLELAGR